MTGYGISVFIVCYFFSFANFEWYVLTFKYDYYMQSQASKCIIELGTIPLTAIEKFTDVSFAFLHKRTTCKVCASLGAVLKHYYLKFFVSYCVIT